MQLKVVFYTKLRARNRNASNKFSNVSRPPRSHSLVKRINSDGRHRFQPLCVRSRRRQKTRTAGTILTMVKHRCSNQYEGIAACLVAFHRAEMDNTAFSQFRVK